MNVIHLKDVSEIFDKHTSCMIYTSKPIYIDLHIDSLL